MAQASAPTPLIQRWPLGPWTTRLVITALAVIVLTGLVGTAIALWPDSGTGRLTGVSSQEDGSAGGFGDILFGRDEGKADGAVAPGLPDRGEPAPSDAEGYAYEAQASTRSIISTAGVTVEVAAVRPAMDQLRLIAESEGGFLEHLSASGGPEPTYANAALRVPGDRFFDTLDRIKALGDVQAENAGSSDVTDQLIDLEARLTSEQRTEESMLGLLERAESVSDVLTIERELTRVRAEIERLQAQQQSLERSVALATISVTLTTPTQGEPSSASLALDVSDALAALGAARNAVDIAGGAVENVTIEQRRSEGELTQVNLLVTVPEAEFDGMVAFLDGLGDVRSKIVRSAGGETPAGGEAPLSVSLTQQDGGSSRWLTVGAPIGGGVALLLLMAGAFAVGRRRPA